MVRSINSKSSLSWYKTKNIVILDFATEITDQQEDQEANMSGNNNNTTLRPSQGNKILDYANSKGIKIYKRATSALKDKYNGKSKGIAVFQMQLSDHAITEVWANKLTGDIINMPKDGVDTANGVVNIIKQHTQILVAVLTTWATSNLFSNNVTRKCKTMKI